MYIDPLLASPLDSRDYTHYVTTVSQLNSPLLTYALLLDNFDTNVGVEYATLGSQMVAQHLSSVGQLGPYLAGMLEGDGSFSTPGLLSGNTPTIYISFNIKDLEFAHFLMDILGGSIQPEANTTQAIRLVFRAQEDILKIIQLINGHMRTPKIGALVKMIEFANFHE